MRHGWLAFVVFATGAALAQLFVVVAPRRGAQQRGTLSYHTTGVFLLPAALLLAPPLAALVPVVQHLPEWLKKRQPWYIATFNIFNYTLTVLAALAVNRWVLERDGILSNPHAAHRRRRPRGLRRLRPREPRPARGDVPPRPQHLDPRVRAVRRRIRLGRVRARRARRRRSRRSGARTPGCCRSRSRRSCSSTARSRCPRSRLQARIDPKTGLFNARHFAAPSRTSSSRAERFERPLSLLMCDLDLLRDINNNYGHLAGDAVLRGVADVFRAAAAPLRHPGALRRRGVLDPPAGDRRRAGARDRRADPARRRRAPLRGRDVERADPRHDLDRRRDFPTRRGRPERARSTRPTSPSTARSSRDGTASLAARAEQLLLAARRSRSRSVPATRSGQPRAATQPSRRRSRSCRAIPRPHAAERRRVPLAVGPPRPARRRRRHRSASPPASLGASTAQHRLLGHDRDHRARRRSARRSPPGSTRARSRSPPSARSPARRSSGPRAALADRDRRPSSSTGAPAPTRLHQLLFNIGALTLASLAAAGVFAARRPPPGRRRCRAGVAAGVAYFAVNTGLLALAVAVEGHEPLVARLPRALRAGSCRTTSSTASSPA